MGRKVGVVGFLLSVGIACTQLFGEQQNTLAPAPGKTPPINTLTVPDPTREAFALAVCAAGQMRCEGALLQTCSDDLASWVTLERCAAAALCQSNPASCLAATCSADEMTCAGAVLQKCNADRTGWDLFATCLSPAHCNADQRQCLTEPCAPGQRRCDRSELDQAPVLEVCRDDRLDWGALDACVTRELCDQTLTGGTPGGGLILGSDGIPQVQAPVAPDLILKCNLPACNVGEVRCNGARLEFCSEGRTGWISGEECASAALCTGSLNNVGSSGAPVCLPPACGIGQHQCSATGVLQVCSEDRTGFRDQEACIGPPFCNAVLADQGQAGCRDAPCEAGLMQCNGAQIQVCREDRTALDDVGAACESTALCNADDPANAFCEEPACRRGATSGSEFQCQGAQLQRCNELLTGYDTIQTCTTAALCDASQRFNGCRPPVCQPGQHDCSVGFLRTCNADQTAFENTENCGSQAQCDANAGRCADPCEPGATRCNQANGDLERCTDRLTGWQPIADCPNVQLCDLPNGRCDICLGDQFSCADNQLRQCAPDGGTFRRQNIGPECAALPNNAGVGVRGCQNNQVVVTPCPNGCTNGRCNACTPQGCNDGNNCTNDSCDIVRGCQFAPVPNRTTCDPPSGTLQSCTNGNPQTVACGQLGCAPNSTICNNCNAGQCNGNQFTPCNNGRFGTPIPCNDTDGNVCTSVACNPQLGCVTQPLSNISCSDNNACTGNEVCQNGTCSNPTDVSCPDPGVCKTSSCNPANGSCGTTNQPNGTGCPGGTCQGGNCQRCSPNSATCANGSTRSVCAPDGSGTTNQPCMGTTRFCVGAGSCVACLTNTDCDDGNACTTNTCNAQNACTFPAIGGCTTCNFTGTRCQPNGTLGTCTGGRLTTSPCANGCTGTNTACNPAPTPPPAPTCTQGERRCNGTTLEECRFGLNPAQTAPVFTIISNCTGGAQITTCPTANGTPQQRFCDDNNSCTTDTCQANACTIAALPATGRGSGCPCTDSNQCSGFCQNGACNTID